jgi:hypothetical protein
VRAARSARLKELNAWFRKSTGKTKQQIGRDAEPLNLLQVDRPKVVGQFDENRIEKISLATVPVFQTNLSSLYFLGDDGECERGGGRPMLNNRRLHDEVLGFPSVARPSRKAAVRRRAVRAAKLAPTGALIMAFNSAFFASSKSHSLRRVTLKVRSLYYCCDSVDDYLLAACIGRRFTGKVADCISLPSGYRPVAVTLGHGVARHRQRPFFAGRDWRPHSTPTRLTSLVPDTRTQKWTIKSAAPITA